MGKEWENMLEDVMIFSTCEDSKEKKNQPGIFFFLPALGGRA